ncbi:MAG: FAD-dependent oxidoreductase [Candidatus Uhrbacteria bacterium]
MYDALGDYFKHEYARLSFTFQAKYLGMSPWECPAAFSMVPYVEHFFGIYHIRGGLSETAVAMARAIEEDGGKIHYNSPVKELILEGKKVIGVELATGEKILADRVIVNADFSYAMNNLLPVGTLKKYTPAKFKKLKYSCSIFMMYLGVNKKFDLKHHSIAFADDYRKNVKDIFGGQLTEKDFSVYLRDASAVDPTLAPAGKSALYVLVPVPNNRAGIDWSEKAPLIRDQVLEILEKKLGLIVHPTR